MKHSESIVNISKALLEAQNKIKDPKQTADNPFFHSKYTPLVDILQMARPIFNECGLIILQNIDGLKVSTIFLHESGEWIEQDGVELPVDKATPQGGAGSITYARRYSISALLGIASEEDDDGNQSSKEPVERIKTEFNGEEIQILTEGMEVPQTFWNIPKEKRYNYIEKGCSITKIEGKYVVLRK